MSAAPITEALTRIPARDAFAFSPSGRQVARLIRADGAFGAEIRSLEQDGPVHRVAGLDAVLTVDTQILFPSEEHVLMCSRQGESCTVMEARRSARDDGVGWRASAIGEVAGDAVRLLTAARDVGWDGVVSWGDDGASTIWRVDREERRLRALARVPGLLEGGVWLDTRTLAFNLAEGPDAPVSGYLVDLHGARFQRLFHVSDHSDDRIALFARGVVAVTSEAFGYRRAGVVDLAGRTARFLPDVAGEDRSVDVLAATADGRHLVLRRQRGVASELWLADPVEMRLSRVLDMPVGLFGHPVASLPDRLRFVFTCPTVPLLSASYHLSDRTFHLDEAPDLGGLSPDDLVAPRLATFPGASGPIEALVYEPPSAQRRQFVVVALHGGPVGQWSAAFSPHLQLLAGLGATVIAPNQHGSTGYGHEFVRSLEQGAGSVDLGDVVAVGKAQREAGSRRRPVVLYGESYGAFLALLAAASRPELWDAVIAWAPFASLSSLREVASAEVRRLLDLLAGSALNRSESDLRTRCRDLRCPVFVAHGTEDRTIPVDQSRALCEALRTCGYVDGEDLWFLEVAGAGHAILDPSAQLRLYHQIEAFLAAVTDRDTSFHTALDGRGGGRRAPPCAPESWARCDTPGKEVIA